jgi:acyl-CoA reductase-like NAD-dependent aldehyde dehydrogenase
MTIKAINPATGEQFASYGEMTDAGVQDAIGKAVCTENLIRVDEVKESPKLTE